VKSPDFPELSLCRLSLASTHVVETIGCGVVGIRQQLQAMPTWMPTRVKTTWPCLVQHLLSKSSALWTDTELLAMVLDGMRCFSTISLQLFHIFISGFVDGLDGLMCSMGILPRWRHLTYSPPGLQHNVARALS